ncbi:MAG TPA: protease pro-enzyme activation domain-containing protein [Pseudonocardiaceae bacterium]|jgi:subtilase family serine protease|nr:protease pro-enzyme activation domain-containing protein [Pseudonocardiaceae bacterium]
MHLRRTAVTAVCLLTVTLSAGVAQATPGEVTIPDSVAAGLASSGLATGDVPAGQNRTVQLWLNGNQTGATAFADTVSDPKNADYRHFLTPSAYTSRFGASAAGAQAVRTWLTQQGFHNVAIDAQRSYVQATAPVSTVQNAFRVRMKTFDVAGRTITSNDRDVTMPASIATDVFAVTGLNSTPPRRSAARPAADPSNCSTYFGQNHQTVPAIGGVTSVPTRVCGYTGTQLRAAYGMTNAATGKGVTVAYIEVGEPDKMFQTLTTWAKAGGLPAPRSANYSELLLGNGAACGNPFDVEEQLDIEAGYAMAPDQHELMVGGDSCNQQDSGNQAAIDALSAVLDGNGDHPLASIASNSWGPAVTETGDPADVPVMHTLLLRAAAEGVGAYIASGDVPGVGTPQDDPYATGVGSTSLGLDANNKRLFETGWSMGQQDINANGTYTDQGIVGGSSGGVSALFDEPRYQKGVVPSSMAARAGKGPGRVVPDISTVGDPITGMSTGVTEPGANGAPDTYSAFPVGGASLSAPLFAGIVAAAQQGLPAPFGFINPLLYSLYGTSAYHDTLPLTAQSPVAYRYVYGPADQPGGLPYVITMDDQEPGKTLQVTARGYDTMTGVGTPNGRSFLDALRRY